MAIRKPSPQEETKPGQQKRRPLRKKAAAKDVGSVLLDTRRKILQNRRQLTKTLLDLAENVEKVLTLRGRDQERDRARSDDKSATAFFPQDITAKAVNSFLLETGLFQRDIKFFREFSKSLGKHKELLIEQAVQFDTIKAMVAASQETRIEALTRISAGANLGPRQIRHIEREFQLFASSIDERQSRAYDEKLNRGAIRLGRKNAEEFRSAVAKFVHNLSDFDELRQLLPSQDDLEALLILGDFNLQRFDAARAALLEEAVPLLAWFDKLFPGMCMPIEDWIDLPPDSADLLLTKARYLISQVSQGNLSAISMEFSEFLEVDGLNTLWRLCETPHHSATGETQTPADENRTDGGLPQATDTPIKRAKAASSVLSETNPIRRYSAVEIFSSSGAGALGLEAASFHVVAVTEDRAVARTTVTANRPDWGIAEDATSFHIDAAIPSGMKAKGVDVICGALPGWPWHRKKKGAADGEHAFPKVISLIRDMRPNGFFFENAEEFLDARHALFKNKIIQEFSALGYLADFFTVRGREYGLAQERNRTVIMGVKRSLKKELVPPLINPGVYYPLETFLADILLGPEGSDSDKAAYAEWRSISEIRHTLTPDLYSLTDPYSAVLRMWRKVGFECDDLLSPSKKRRKRKDKPPSISLTIPILKALQGIPAYWNFEGSSREQVEQICMTTPPALMRLFAQAMHATLTGHFVDLSASLKEPFAKPMPWALLESPKPVRSRGFKKQIPYSRQPTYLYDDPQAEKSRRYRVEQETLNGPSRLNDDEIIPLKSSSLSAEQKRLEFTRASIDDRKTVAREKRHGPRQ